MPLKTHKPSGKAGWPILLLAGGEKCGKSYSAAQFSASDMIDRTFWIEIGEMTAEEYGAMKGARYEVVDHDGSYKSILEAVEEIVALPRGKKPNCIVIDSFTKLWDLLKDEQVAIMTKRNKSVITMDQWVGVNGAKTKWHTLFDTLRKFYGPVIITARYEQVAVVVGGKPVEGKSEWKIKSEKNLGFDVDGTIMMPKPRKYFLSGIKSLRYDVPVGGFQEIEDFTVDRFLRTLGIDEFAERAYVPLRADVSDEPQRGVTYADLDGIPSHTGTAESPAEGHTAPGEAIGERYVSHAGADRQTEGPMFPDKTGKKK